METKVLVPGPLGGPRKGTVVGIAEPHVAYRYIILLDEPMPTPEGPVRAVTALGTLLEGSDGSNWRVHPKQALDL